MLGKEGVARQGHEEQVRQLANIDRPAIAVLEVIEHPGDVRDQDQVRRRGGIVTAGECYRLADGLRGGFSLGRRAHAKTAIIR